MATYRYTAMTAGGQRVEGTLTALSEQAVLDELEHRRLIPVDVRAGRAGPMMLTRRVSTRRLGEAYGQIADLLRAGVPLLRALKLLGGQRSRGYLAEVCRELAEAVEKGTDLAGAMEARPGVFPTVHVAMVRAGERGGFLEQVFARLQVLVTRQADLRSKVVGSLIYPTLLVVVGIGIGGLIFGVFVPKFRDMFTRLGDNLPGITKAIFLISDLLTTYGAATAVVVGLMVAGGWYALRREEVSRWVSARVIRMPVIGAIVRGFATARFCGLLGSMLGNGVPMISALTIAKDGVGHAVLEGAIDEATEAVRSGEHLAPPLARSGMFEEDVVEMIAVGESANNLDEVLTRIGETIEARLDRNLTVAVRLIEPMLLLVLALVVGLVAAGLLLPMSDMSSAL
ncbi:MAG: type IV pilus biogenesis protein PilC [Phycisphaerae bacterium]|nr:MAG: type IV pilus biogenesis protein PilC [Phycisphaerae bacterium]